VFGCEGDAWVEGGFFFVMPFASVMPCAGGGVPSNVADIFNVSAGTWSTAVLSQARGFLAATSLPNAGVAIFAGGQGTCCCVCFGLMHDGVRVREGCMSWGSVVC
jgi:hypothetical protein